MHFLCSFFNFCIFLELLWSKRKLRILRKTKKYVLKFKMWWSRLNFIIDQIESNGVYYQKSILCRFALKKVKLWYVLLLRLLRTLVFKLSITPSKSKSLRFRECIVTVKQKRVESFECCHEKSKSGSKSGPIPENASIEIM